MKIKSTIMKWIGRQVGLSDHEFWRAYFGTETWAGEDVNPDTAMQVSAFWACVRLISQTIGTLPLSLYERREDGGRDAQTGNPLYRLLHDQPNADQTSVEFWEGVGACLCLTGNSFALKDFGTRRTGGSPALAALTLLRPDHMIVERTERGDLRYRYNDPFDHKQKIYSEDRIFHIRGFGIGGDIGLSPVSFARQSLSSARAAERASSSIFANGLRPSGWMIYKGGLLKPEQRDQVRQNIIEPMSGAANAGKIGILEADFDYKQITIPPEDAQLLETRSFGVEEVCRWLGVPPVMIGHAGSGVPAWGTGIETLLIGWLTLGLRPYLARIEKAILRSLIPPEEQARLYAEFNLEGLLRADSAARSALYSTFAQNGIMTRNEIRAKENLPRVEGGDVLTVQSNLIPIDQLGAALNASPEAVRSALFNLLQPPEPQRPNLQIVKDSRS